MLNRVWFWLLVIGIGYGFCKAAYQTVRPPDPPAVGVAEAAEPAADAAAAPDSPLQSVGKELTGAAIDAATLSVDLCLALAGVMILWMGLLQVAKDAGMVDALAWALRPVLRWLFPDVPDGHPAQGAMLMNISANMLGLDNAATPFGLKAMKELQDLNETKETASNSMAMFLAINTSSVTLVPISVIALREASGSSSPASPFVGILLATIASTIAAIIAVRTLSRLPQFALRPEDYAVPADNEVESAADGDVSSGGQ